jgi:hypothetical protein
MWVLPKMRAGRLGWGNGEGQEELPEDDNCVILGSCLEPRARKKNQMRGRQKMPRYVIAKALKLFTDKSNDTYD